MVDLLVLTCLDQIPFNSKWYLHFFTKQATLMRRLTVLSLQFQLVFPAMTVRKLHNQSHRDMF
jgi:hypothetical protein